MISINNILYYCEILGCNNIYLNPKINWYIKNKIVTEIFNISLNSNVNCKDSTTLCVSLIHNNFWFYIITVRPEIRINILKNEMKRNLPQLKIDKDDLYIHIRVNKLNVNYGQPPLCFYETIINNFKFKNIYLISGIKSSPLIDKLLSEYPNIIFQINSKEVDISYLANAYNLSPMGDYELSFDWSYSLLEDTQTEWNQLTLAENKGVISKVELRQWLKPDETLEESQKAIDEIQATNPTVDDMLGTRGEE